MTSAFRGGAGWLPIHVGLWAMKEQGAPPFWERGSAWVGLYWVQKAQSVDAAGNEAGVM